MAQPLPDPAWIEIERLGQAMRAALEAEELESARALALQRHRQMVAWFDAASAPARTLAVVEPLQQMLASDRELLQQLECLRTELGQRLASLQRDVQGARAYAETAGVMPS